MLFCFYQCWAYSNWHLAKNLEAFGFGCGWIWNPELVGGMTATSYRGLQRPAGGLGGCTSGAELRACLLSRLSLCGSCINSTALCFVKPGVSTHARSLARLREGPGESSEWLWGRAEDWESWKNRPRAGRAGGAERPARLAPSWPQALFLSHSSSFSSLEPSPVGPAVSGYSDHVVLQVPGLL